MGLRYFLFCLFTLTIAVHSQASSLIASAECEAAVPEPPPKTFIEAAEFLHRHSKCIRADIGNGAKNADSVTRIAMILPLLDYAIAAPMPKTPASTAEAALVGEDNAQAKYKGLMQSVKVTLLELSGTLKAKGSNVCGPTCDSSFDQIDKLEAIGHVTFRDGRP